MSTVPSVPPFDRDRLLGGADRDLAERGARTDRALDFVRRNPGARIPAIAPFVYPDLDELEARRKTTTLIGSLALRGLVRRAERGAYEIAPPKSRARKKLSRLRMVGKVRSAVVRNERSLVTIEFSGGDFSIEWPSGSGLPDVGEAWIFEARRRER